MKDKNNPLKEKKLLFIANSTFPKGKANRVNVFRMINSFYKAGYKITLIARRSSLMPLKNPWEESCLLMGDQPSIKGIFMWWPFQRGAELMLAFVTLFIVLFKPRNFFLFTRVRYVAFISTLLGHDTFFENHAPPLNKLQKKLDKWMLERSNFHMAVISQRIKDIYAESGMKYNFIIVLPDSGRSFHVGDHEYTENNKIKKLAYIGSLYEGRGFEIIVKLAKKMPNREFHVIGNLSHVKHKNLPSNIILYGEMSPHQAEIMTRHFDVLLIPYQYKVHVPNGLDTSQWMSPLKMFEYLHSGRAIISSDLPVIREVLKNNENALLVPPENIDAWLEAIEKLDDPKIRFRLATQALKEAQDLYTWDKRVRTVMSYLTNSGLT